MNTGFFRDALERKPALMRAMLRFNGLLAPALPAVSGVNMALLCREPCVRRRCTTGTATPFWDFTEESRRMALCTAAELARLGLVFAVAAHGTAIAQLLWREDVLALRADIGAELCRYAVLRGRFQLAQDKWRGLSAESPLMTKGLSLPRQAAANDDQLMQPSEMLKENTALYPDAQNSDAPCPDVLPPACALGSRIRRAGMLALLTVRTGWPQALITASAPLFQRTATRLLPAEDNVPAPAPCAEQQRRALWADMKKLLLKEVAPRWTPCFT